MLESMPFSFASLNIELLLPLCICLLGGVVLLLVGIFSTYKSSELFALIALLFVLLNLVVFGFGVESSAQSGFFNLIISDGISQLGYITMLVATLLILLCFMQKCAHKEMQNAEYFALLLFSVAGFGFMLSSNNLVLIILGLECASLCLYALIAMQEEHKAFEASIKYFTMGALATAFYALGAMILYGATGSVDITHIRAVMADESFEAQILAYMGFMCLLCAFGFKVSMVPFHTWTPDVYEGSNALLAAFVAIVPKIATFCVIMRLFGVFLDMHNAMLESVLFALVVLSMSVPNLVALVQNDVKRMLAYSSISHSGFVLAAILVNAESSQSAVFLYWILFLFSNIGAFAVLYFSIECASGDRAHSFESFSGLIHTNKTLAILLSLFMFSLAGIPPFAVFWGKMYLMANALNNGFVALAIIMAINSAIAGYYYLKLVIYIFAKAPNATQSPQTHLPFKLSLPSLSALFITALVSIICAFMVQNLLNIITSYLAL